MPTNYFIHMTHSNVSRCCYRNLDQSAALKENSNMGIYSRESTSRTSTQVRTLTKSQNAHMKEIPRICSNEEKSFQAGEKEE